MSIYVLRWHFKLIKWNEYLCIYAVWYAVPCIPPVCPCTPPCVVCACVYIPAIPPAACAALWVFCGWYVKGSIFMPCYIFCVIIVSNASSLPCKPAIVVEQGNYTMEAWNAMQGISGLLWLIWAYCASNGCGWWIRSCLYVAVHGTPYPPPKIPGHHPVLRQPLIHSIKQKAFSVWVHFRNPNSFFSFRIVSNAPIILCTAF